MKIAFWGKGNDSLDKAVEKVLTAENAKNIRRRPRSKMCLLDRYDNEACFGYHKSFRRRGKILC